MTQPIDGSTTILASTLLVRTLARAGVRSLFAIHGAHVDSLLQGAVDTGVAVIDMRHEAAAGHAAEAYARITRGPGVAVVTAGAGFTNVVSSIANAWTDRTPVLYLAGAPGLNEAETNGLQGGIDQVAMVGPITKWAHQVNRADDIERLVAHAIRVATTAPMGPVLLNLPMDIGLTPVAVPETPRANLITDHAHFPPPAQIAAARALLAGARRPVVIAGQDAWYGDAGPALLRFAETTGIPVFSDFVSHGLMPSDHPLYGGTGHKLAYVGDARPDVVLMLGMRFGLFTLGDAHLLFPPEAQVIHVSEDAAEIGRVREAAVGIAASMVPTLDALTDTPPALDRDAIDAWAATVRAARPARIAELDTQAQGHNGPIHPWVAVKAVAAAARDHILVADGAEAYHWLNDALAQAYPGSYLTHGHFGCMGIGMGLSVGAQTARPDRRVILLTGDGAVGFNIAEFDTMVRKDLPIVVVVMKNRGWGASVHYQEVVPAATSKVGTALRDTDYAAVARGFGAEGMSVTKAEDLAPALARALAMQRPTCIDVLIDVDPIAPELILMMSQ